jgi:hypothetical protein
MLRRTLFVIAIASAAAGCRTSEFEDATPEASAFSLELTGDSASEALPPDETAPAALGSSQQALGAPVPEWLAHTRFAIASLNAAVARVLRPIETLIALDHGQAAIGDSRTWGPHDDAGATYRFTMKKLALKTYGWALEAKPLGAPDASYQVVMAGAIELGVLPHRGRGVMGIDLDKLAAIDTTVHGAGQLLVGFAHVDGFKVLAYGLHGFTPDVSTFDPVDAVFSGWRGPDGATRVRVAAYDDLGGSPSPARELLLMHARWRPLVGGRVDAIVSAGDVPAGHVFQASACIDRDLDEGFLIERDCAVGGGCSVIRTAGSVSACFFGDEELPAADPMDPTLEPGAPENPSIPTSMPLH